MIAVTGGVLQHLRRTAIRYRRLLPVVKWIVIATIFFFSVRALHSMLAGYRWGEFTAYLRTLPPTQIAAASLLALVTYFITTGYDSIAFRHIRHGLPYGWIALAAFTAYAINNNLGMSGIVGSSLRYRLYRRFGVTRGDIARVFVFCTVTFYLGFAILGGLVLLLWPPVTAKALHVPFGSLRIVGAVLLAAGAAYSVWILLQRAPLRFRRWTVALPKRSIFIAQLIISMGEWIIAAVVLYTVLPLPSSVPYQTLLGTFFVAQIAGLASNVPGGLGVFDTVVLISLRAHLPPLVILGALVMFRAVYFFLPLALALIILVAHELWVKLRWEPRNRTP